MPRSSPTAPASSLLPSFRLTAGPAAYARWQRAKLEPLAEQTDRRRRTHRAGCRVSILADLVFRPIDDTDSGEEERDEHDGGCQQARQRTGTPDRRPVGVRAAGLRLRLRQPR